MPVNIKPHVQTTLAWDNNDRLEESLTGKGTSHRVNGIAVQARVFGPEPQKLDAPVHKSRRRTIDHVVEDLPVNNSGVRCFGVRVSVMFHFMFVHYTFSSVWVAEWPPFGKYLPARLAICSHCILSICNIYLFPALVLRAGFAF